MLGEKVGRVRRAQHLVQGDGLGPDLLLDPELAHGKVADLADPTPGADAYRSTRVSVHSHTALCTQISGQALEPKSLASSLNHS